MLTKQHYKALILTNQKGKGTNKEGKGANKEDKGQDKIVNKKTTLFSININNQDLYIKLDNIAQYIDNYTY